MRITADTNVLVRAVMADEPRQSRAAQKALENAERVAITLPALCEFVWVLSDSYDVERGEIVSVIRAVLNSTNVAVNRPAAEAGLALLEAGGDFVDGVIAFEGGTLGAETFVSFDKKAVKLWEARGEAARLLT